MSERVITSETDRISIRAADADWCGVTCAMRVIDHKWHPVIVDRLLAHEMLRFNQLLSEIAGITNKTLSDSLADLEAKGIVDRTVVDARPVRVEYSLTDRGRSLAPVIEALDAWGTTHTELVSDEQLASE